MNLTAILLLSTGLMVSANSHSQTVTLDLKNASIQKVLREVIRQTGTSIVYKEKFFKNTAPVTIKVRNATITDVLNKCLQQQSFTFKVEGNIIVISEKPVSTPAVQKENNPPPIEVRGSVKDENNNPLANASVTIKGSVQGVTTNNNGDFTINVPDNKTVLVISYIGYEDQEVVVGDRSSISIKLLPAANALTDVVVTALGISRAEKSLTYAAQVVGGSDVSTAKETNLINSLQGKVSGVVISRSATGPGGSSKVLLRGIRSITGGNEPLYIIDGVPLNTGRRESGGGDFGGRDGGGGISMLNPDNIESMTVLKGASAAALYGSAGQNGAIVITTKSGKSGQIRTEYNGGIMTDKAFYLPKFQSGYGQGDGGIYNPNSEHSYGPKADGHEVTLWNGQKAPYTNHTDNMAKFLRTGTTFNNTISATGGGEKMRTFFSYGNVRAMGILRNNDMTRHNIDLKIDNNITSKLSISAKVSYIYQELNNMPKTGEQGYAVSSIYRAPLSIPLDMMKEFNYYDAEGKEFQNYWKPQSSIISNPYWDMYREPYFEKKDRALGLFVAKYQFTDWMDIQVRGSIDKTMEKTDERYYNDTYTTYGIGSTMIVNDYMRQSTNVDALLSINRDLTSDLNLDIHAGGSLQQGSATSISVNANGLFKQNYFFLSNAKNPTTSSSFSQSPQVQSLYGMATLGYKNSLFLDVTARNDWSSALPKENWSYFYPSVGLSGILSDMFKMPYWVSYGKLRVSYAQSGSGGGAYRDRYYYGVAAGGGITLPATKSLPTYKPELTSSFEIGAEWWFFKKRVGFDFTYYTSDTRNQLITITTPPPSLFSSQYINAGLINNHGVEATLYVTPVRTDNFEWNANFNFSKNTNKVIRLTDELKRFIITDQRGVMVVADEGHKFGDMYGTGWRRDASGRPLVDANGLPLLTGGKTVYLGNYNPDFNAGFTNSLQYKNLSLSFLITYQQGGTVTSSTQALLDADGHSEASLWGREGGIVLDAYTEDGSKNTNAITPQQYFGTIGERYFSGEFYSYSATNIRLRELTLGYNFSGILRNGGFVKGLHFYVVGRNLFFLKNEAPFDPEMLTGIGNWGGVEYTSLPTTRSLGFNLKLAF